MKTWKLCLVNLCLLASMPAWAANDDVVLNVTGLTATLDNGLAHFKFAEDATARVVGTDEVNLVDKLSGPGADPSRLRSFYLDYHSGKGQAFKPETLQVIEQKPERAHIAFIQRNGKLDLEYHLVMTRGEPGLYSYVVAKNPSKEPLLVSELRTIYRFNAGLMNRLYTAQGSSTPPLYGELAKHPKLQDETWRLPDGAAYSKYDLVDYQRRNPFWGAYGNGYGAWFIPVNHDYFSGGPLKQDLMVHQDAIVLNYMTGAHMGTPDLIAPVGWQKLYGPWFIYLNRGEDSKLIADAAKYAEAKMQQWPFAWMDDANYPLQRASVGGKVNLRGRRGELFSVILSPEEGDPEQQTLGFLYHATTTASGAFNFKTVRPGRYWLTVMTEIGADQGILYQQPVEIRGDKQAIPTVDLPAPGRYLWIIGAADRTAKGFKLADKPRNLDWATQVPESLEFNVEKQRDTEWYYAQTKSGDWNIHYREAQRPGSRKLNIAFAAASNNNMEKTATSPKMAVLVNGTQVAEIAYPNDKTIYRGGMRNGFYHQVSTSIPAGLLKRGNNVITLRNLGGAFMFDSINLQDK